METNQSTETLLNTAMLPNFLALLALALLMGALWYLLDHQR